MFLLCLSFKNVHIADHVSYKTAYPLFCITDREKKLMYLLFLEIHLPENQKKSKVFIYLI